MLNTGSAGWSASGFHVHGDNLEGTHPQVKKRKEKTWTPVAESYKLRRKTSAASALVIPRDSNVPGGMSGLKWAALLFS